MAERELKFSFSLTTAASPRHCVVVLMRFVQWTDACSAWYALAYKESQTGRPQICTIRYYECALMDCFGTQRFLQHRYSAFIKHNITLGFCFGLLMNYCTEPLSMDFYIQIPAKRLGKTLKITEDNFKFEWKEAFQPMTIMGIAYPLLTFRFKINTNSTVHFSINLEVNVETRYGVFTIPNYNTYLISDHIVPLKVCDRIIKGNKMAPDYFAPVMCKVKSHTHPITDSPAKWGTVNTSCDMKNTFCGYGEKCDLSLEEPKCVCSSRFQLNARKDACVSLSKLNQPCVHDDDCGVDEECKKNALNKGMFCQCSKDYEYSTILDMCAEPPLRYNKVLKAIKWILAAAIGFGVIICCIRYCYHLRSQRSSTDYSI